MADTYMQYEHEELGVLARWHGGEYIDIGYTDPTGEFHATDVINVWDHARDEPRIPRTLSALAAEVEDHFNDEDEEDEE
jgi:hypothetical protein